MQTFLFLEFKNMNVLKREATAPISMLKKNTDLYSLYYSKRDNNSFIFNTSDMYYQLFEKDESKQKLDHVIDLLFAHHTRNNTVLNS